MKMNNVDDLDEIIKVFCIYFKKSGALYAWTADKDCKNAFLQQRNAKLFVVEKENLHRTEFVRFSKMYQSQKLNEIPIGSTFEENLSMQITTEEYTELNDYCDKIQSIMEVASFNALNRYRLKKKYMDALLYLTEISFIKDYPTESDDIHEAVNSGMNVSTINQLYIFTKLFKNTFEEKDDENE